MKKLMVVLMVLIGMKANAQITFVKTYNYGNGNGYGGVASGVQQTSDGGYIITSGCYQSGFTSIYLVKTNADGDTLWSRIYGHGSAGSSNRGFSVQQTNDGGYVVVGTIEDATTDQVDLYLIKTNSTGDTLWTKSYGSTGNDYGYSVKQTNDNGFIIAGATDGLGAGGIDAFLIKTNSVGDTLWTKTYGGIYDDRAASVELTTDGGYIIAGTTNIGNMFTNDVYLIKTDSIGDTLWTKAYGNGHELGYSVKQTSDGGYIISGNALPGNNSQPFYLIKTNTLGDTLWTKTYDDNSGNPQTAFYVQQTTDGGYIIVGDMNFAFEGFTTIHIIKTNSIGDTLWTRSYNGLINGPGNSVQQTMDGGYIIIGESGYNRLLIKTDSNGNSGCSQYNPIITNSFPTQVLNTTTIVKAGCLVSNPSNPVGSCGTTLTTDCFSASINEITNNSSISLFPNPFSSSATLVISVVETRLIASLQIYNLLGQEVKTIPIINQNEITINRDNLADGMYFYKIINQNKETVAVGKFVVEL